ncbi:DUF533 domain-containing protein [Bartonella sp. HY761]|uniref:DUF533 domain-containing protein n=1 Tax=Bartonella sp. HY761 TaxID=2979330 RepID=UPI0021FC7721|nr:DUF533 domain-containing protein [Bartonella sp. HY761]UXN05785.1 DUF533 domain-containing protein [Bartonella sp. HY761]
MGISIFKNITSQQSKDFWEQHIASSDGVSVNETNNGLIDYAKDIDTYNFDSAFFIIPLLRSKIHEAKSSHHISSEQKEEIVDLIYNSDLGDYYKKSLIDHLESPINLDAVIDEAKANSYYTKAYFSSLLTSSSDEKDHLLELRSQISLSDTELQKIAFDMITLMHNNHGVQLTNED